MSIYWVPAVLALRKRGSLCACAPERVMKIQITTIYRALVSAPGHCQSLVHLVSASGFEVRISFIQMRKLRCRKAEPLVQGSVTAVED